MKPTQPQVMAALKPSSLAPTYIPFPNFSFLRQCEDSVKIISSPAGISLITSSLPDQGFLEVFEVAVQNFNVPVTSVEAVVS